MSSKLDPELKLADFVLIELMKCDEDHADFDPNIDPLVASELKRQYKKDEETWLPRLIADRAAIYQEEKGGVSADGLHKSINHLGGCILGGLVILVLLFCCFYFIGVPQSLFSGEENQVNLPRLVGLIALPLLFSTLAFICSLLLFFKPKQTKQNSSKRWEWIPKFFGWLPIGLVSYLSVLGLIRLSWSFWRHFRGSDLSPAENSLEVVMFRTRRVASICFLAISNLIVLFLNFVALAAVAFFLAGHETCYVWKGSMEETISKTAVIDAISGLPFVTALDSEAKRWAIGETGAEALDLDFDAREKPVYSEKSLRSFRDQWSWFLLSAMFVAGILPRIPVGIISFFLLRRAKYELLPKSSNASCHQIAGNVLNPPMGFQGEEISVELNVEEISPTNPVARHDGNLDAAVESPQPVHAKKTLLVSYELKPVTFDQLARDFTSQETEVLSVASAQARHECIQRLSDAKEFDRVILFVRATVVPDTAFETFLSKTAAHVRCGMAVIGANEHLESVNGNGQAHENRIFQWKRSASAQGIEASNIAVAEIDTDSGQADIFRLIRGQDESPLTETAKMAGRFATALALIKEDLGAACRGKDVRESSDWQRVCDETREKMISIYQAEYSSFLSSLESGKWGKPVADIGSKIGQIQLPESAQGSLDELKGSLEKLNHMNGLLESLSPKWMIAGAFAGVGVTVALPFLAGGLAAAPLVAAVLPWGAAGGAGATQGLKTYLSRFGSSEKAGEDPVEDEMRDYSGVDLDTTARSLMLFVLILEYENNSHKLATQSIQEHIVEIGDNLIDSEATMLDQINVLETRLSANWNEN